jgi:hypothetical protein
MPRIFDFGKEMAKIEVHFDEFANHMTEQQQKVRQAQDLMRLYDMGILDRMAVIQESQVLSDWFVEAKKIEHAPLEKRPAEKVEPAPGKRKIVL